MKTPRRQFGYTIVEQDARSAAELEIGVFERAYDAVDEFRRALSAKEPRVWRWRLVDEAGTVLLGPSDLVAIVG